MYLQILRRTGQVESALGGENIFLKQPEPDQPIFVSITSNYVMVKYEPLYLRLPFWWRSKYICCFTKSATIKVNLLLKLGTKE